MHVTVKVNYKIDILTKDFIFISSNLIYVVMQDERKYSVSAFAGRVNKQS